MTSITRIKEPRSDLSPETLERLAEEIQAQVRRYREATDETCVPPESDPKSDH